MSRPRNLIEQTEGRMYLADSARESCELYLRCKMAQLMKGVEASKEMQRFNPDDTGIYNQLMYYQRAVSTCEWLISDLRKSFALGD